MANGQYKFVKNTGSTKGSSKAKKSSGKKAKSKSSKQPSTKGGRKMARRSAGKIPLGITIGLIASGKHIYDEWKAVKAATTNSKLRNDHMVKIFTGYVTPELSAAGGGDPGFSQMGEAMATWAPIGIGYAVSTYIGGKKDGVGMNLNSKLKALPIFKL